MKRTLAISVLLLLVLTTGAPASPVYTWEFEAGKRHVVGGDPVPIRLVNRGTTAITMGETWNLSWLDGEGASFYQWPEDQLRLEPGEVREWEWDQRLNACYGECQNVREGDPAEAGRYEVTTTIDGTEISTRFMLGEYFTLGFRSRPALEFVVYVAEQPQVDQMRDEAYTDDDTDLITSGIVRGRRSYNPDWKFSMGPRSIELGEVFIEGCDASPWYVQRNRSEWLGERWCPWSSYIKRVGR